MNKETGPLTFTEISDTDAKYYRKPVTFVEVNPGHLIIHSLFSTIAQDIIDMPVYESDVWICSFPKTGTTWAGEMAWLIVNGLNFEGAKQLHNMRVPMLELSGIVSDFDIAGTSVDIVKNMPQPRIVKSHLPWDLLPNDMLTKEGRLKAKIIYTSRDPKDACVSDYYFLQMLFDYEIPFAEFCEFYLKGKIVFGSIWKHISEFWKLKNDPNFLFLKYEDMKRDLPDSIGKMATFLNKELSEKQVSVLNEHLAFDKMKTNRAVNFEDFVVHLKDEEFWGKLENKFMRKGVVGDWKSHMTKDMAKRFDDKTRECLGDLNFI